MAQMKAKLWIAADFMILIMFPIFIVFGTVTNIITILVFLRKSLRSSNTAYVLIMLAATDTLNLYMGALPRWLRSLTEEYIETRSKVSCQVYNYFMSVFAMFQPWLILVFTMERVISIVEPFKVKQICTTRNTNKYLSLIMLTICLLCLPTAFFSVSWYEVMFGDEVNFTIHKSCRLNNEACAWIDYLFRCFIPFIMILIGNINIIVNMKKTIEKRQSMSVSTAKAKSDAEDFKNQICLLLFASFSYLILAIPYISYILNRMYGGRYVKNNMFKEGRVLMIDYPPGQWGGEDYVKLDAQGEDHYVYHVENYLYYTISICFMYINNSINFFLYVLGGKTFRDEFYKMIYCDKKG